MSDSDQNPKGEGREPPRLLMDSKLWVVVDEQLGTTIRMDPVGRQGTFLVAVSAFSRRPAHILILGASAIGKTWLALQTVKLLPSEYVLIIGSATQRAWFYCGTPVYKNHPTEQGKKILSHYEVDWRNKVVIVLDNVEEYTIKDLKPVMSHDNPDGTIDILAAQKTTSGKIKTVPVKLIGSPSFINCSTRLKWNEELATRHFFLTPRDDKAKYEAAALLILRREVTGKEPVGPRVAEVREAIKHLVEQDIQVRVRADVAEALKAKFQWNSGRDLRDFERALTLVRSSAWLHAYQRDRDAEGAVLADERDLRICEPLLDEVLKTSRYATSSQVIAFHEKILTPLAADFQGVVSRAQIRDKYKEIYGRLLNHPTLTRYIEVLEDLGLVETLEDPMDRRRRIVKVLQAQTSISRTPTPLLPFLATEEGSPSVNNNSETLLAEKSQIPHSNPIAIPQLKPELTNPGSPRHHVDEIETRQKTSWIWRIVKAVCKPWSKWGSI